MGNVLSMKNLKIGWRRTAELDIEQSGLNNENKIKDHPPPPFVREGKINLDTMSRVLLAGVYDDGCPFSLLRGCPHLLGQIWRLMVLHWRQVIRFPDKICGKDFTWECHGDSEDYTLEGVRPDAFFLTPIYGEHDFDFWGPRKESQRVRFPPPSNVNINMMPFILERSFDKCRLPKFVQPYWSMIETCAWPEFDKADRGHKTQLGKVCYLTIQEGAVRKGESLRVSGLHGDSSGSKGLMTGRIGGHKTGGGQCNPYTGHNFWSGGAHIVDIARNWDWLNFVVMTGGIYMATSVPESVMAWNCKVVPGEEERKDTGKLGNIEHLRAVLPPGQLLTAHQLYWLTDRTPYQSLPLPEGGHMQFFRLVTGEVSLWHRDLFTTNELGVEPDCDITFTTGL